MNKKFIVPIFVVGIVVVIAAVTLSKQQVPAPGGGAVSDTVTDVEVPRSTKEFVTESFVEFVDGNPKPQFSVKEITVQKGDMVRIKVTNTKGVHNFILDEFGISVETPVDEEIVIEFVADKTGEFVYYCSKPGHRQAGHWGTLKVIE